MSSYRLRAGGGAPADPTGDDPGVLFARLEQADTEEANHIKELFRDNLRTLSGEAWLLNGLIDYYVSTGSSRCLDILLSCGEANSRALIDRLHQLLRSSEQRGAGLRLLGYYVRRHPVWLRKLVTQTSPSIVRDLFRIIKSDCEVQCIISASLVLTTLMPMFPVALIEHIQDLFQVLSRLTAMVSSPSSHLGRTYQLHLHVAAYSYFVRVYAMYPCNLLSFLRQHYGQRDNLPVFNRTIRPLLEHVRMHPLLVTGSNTTETSSQRWQRKETHDIVAECSHFSLDVLEASPMDNLTGPLWSLAVPPSQDAAAPDAMGGTDVALDGQECLDVHDILWSPAAFCSLLRQPASPQQQQAGCETAVEATPDTTPAATPTLTPQRDLENPPLLRQNQAPPLGRSGSAASVSAKSRADSIPSSPLKKTPANFRCLEAEMAHSIQQRIGQIVSDRVDDPGGSAGAAPEQAWSGGGLGSDDGTGQRAAVSGGDGADAGGTGTGRSSLSGLRARRTSGKRSPIKLKLGVVSPVQFSEGAPLVTRPVPRASASADAGQPLWSRAPSAGSSGAGGAPTPGQTSSLWHEVANDSAEDLEVSDLTRRGSAATPAGSSPGGSLTPFASTTAQLTQHPLRHLSASGGGPPPGQPTAIPGQRAAAAAAAADDDDDDDDGSPPPPPLGLAASAPQSRFDFDLVRHMTRYYSRHVLPSRQYRRTSSCPDLTAAEPDETGSVTGSATTVTGPRADAASQTEDATIPAPYEHLLASALPPAPQSPQMLASPHRLLLQQGEQAAPSSRLLAELLQYERYKRQVHAHRNRRLFDRTRATGRREEENRALRKQLQELSVDVAECRRQLQLVKRQAARAAEEQRTAARRLEARAAEDAAEMARLTAQLAHQRHSCAELSRQLLLRDQQLADTRRQLLETGRELDCTHGKATQRAQLQARVLELERRLLMAGQQQQQQRACAPGDGPLAGAGGGDQWADALAGAAGSSQSASQEEALRCAEASLVALGEQLKERELTISELRRMLETVRVKHQQQLQALDDKYSAVKQHLQSAETRLLMADSTLSVSPAHSNGSSDSTQAKAAAPDLTNLRAAVGADQ